MDAALRALSSVDFDWTMTLTGVWQNPAYDVEDAHGAVLDDILEPYARLEADEDAKNPLGQVIVGNAGAGKTHFLGSLRRRVIERGGTFLLADLTDVRDFWEIALQGAVTSLTRRLPAGPKQLARVVDALLDRFGQGPLEGVSAAQFAEIRPPALSNRMRALVESIARRFDPHETARYEPVLRSLLLLSSGEPSLLSLGEAWLSGLDVREEAQLVHDLPSADVRAADRLAGLAWVTRFKGPTVIAVDQLDAIASEARAAENAREHAPSSIFTQTTTGLMGLRDVMPRTLVVVSCLEANWQYLRDNALNPVMDRFSPERRLAPLGGRTLERLVARRLAVAYARSGFAPPYPTYPFKPSCFSELRLTPREVLRRAERHRLRCRELGALEEIERLSDGGGSSPDVRVDLSSLDQQFREIRSRVDPEAKLRGSDPELDRLLETACRALEKEQPWPEHVDVELDLDFGQSGQIEPLHARLRVIDRAAGDRERHLSLRFIQQANPIAFQTRLQKAMTESGVGEGLDFRRLVILRSEPLPSGPKTERMLKALRVQNGRLVSPTEDEIRTLTALLRMFEGQPVHFGAWLKKTKPVSALPTFAPHIEFLLGSVAAGPGAGAMGEKTGMNAGATEPDEGGAQRAQAGVERSGSSVEPDEDTIKRARGETEAHEAKRGAKDGGAKVDGTELFRDEGTKRGTPLETEPIVLGHEIQGLGRGPPVWLDVGELNKHVAVLAAAGSGKTVLVRRIVEEAALRGIPSIVIDVANDLVRLGDRWPTPPEGFEAADAAAADRYFERTETVVWTPGRESGNPFSVDPLPNFAPLRDDSDELQAAVALSFELLAGDVKLTSPAPAAQIKRAILRGAIETYARLGGSGLDDLIRVLREPGALVDKYQNGAKQAGAVADQLAAAIELNPLLRSEGRPLDFDVLFGRGSEKTRISVVNLSGLATLGEQQALVARMMTLLFSYAKAHPGRGKMAGLVVIDEAKDFAPSQVKAASSEPIRRAAAQLRKYQYGLIAATQEPRSIDSKVVSNSGTQIFGRALAPAAQHAVADMMSQLGGGAPKVGTLEAGQFFVSVPHATVPTKVRTRWCLSHHGGPRTAEEVRELAAEHRTKLGR